MKPHISLAKLRRPLKQIRLNLKRLALVMPVSILALAPIGIPSAWAANGNPNDQSRVLIQPVKPSSGETISGSYNMVVTTPTVDGTQAELQYCFRPGEETTDLITEVSTQAEDGTTTSTEECTWANMTYNSGPQTWTATVDTTTYADGLYTVPLLLKASGVTGQKYAFIKNVTIANFVAEDAAPVVALQTINVTHSSRPTDAPIRGTALVQGKIVDTDLSSYQLTIAPSDDAGTPTGPTVYDSKTVKQTNPMSAFETIYEWDTTKVDDGTYVITLTAQDKANHESSATLIRKVDNIKGGAGSDTTAEEGSVAALEPIRPVADAYLSGKNYLVQVKLTDPTLLFDTMSMRLQSGSGTEETSGSGTENSNAVTTTANDSGSDPTTEGGNSPWMRMYYNDHSGYWEYNLDTTQYADGVYWMHIRAELASGTVVTDVQTSVRITNLTVDNTPPAVGLDQNNQTVSSKMHVKGTAEDNSGVSNYQWSKVSGPGNVTFSDPNSAETDITADANGDYVVQLTATDTAGNTGTATLYFTWYDPALVPPTTDTTTTEPTTPTTTTTEPTQTTTTPTTLTTSQPTAQLAAEYTTATSTPTTTATPVPLQNSSDTTLGNVTNPGFSDVLTQPNNQNPTNTNKNQNQRVNYWLWTIPVLFLIAVSWLIIALSRRYKNT